MSIVTFNFEKIYTYYNFYNRCRKKFHLPGHFGNNLDALWDVLTGEVALPLTINCINVTPYHEKKFGGLFKLLEDAANELEGQLQVNILKTEEGGIG